MKILYFALFLLLAGLLFVLLNRLFRKLAYPLSRRYLHCRIIPIALVALLAATNVYTISYPLELLDKIINSSQAASVLSFILPNRSYELEYMLLVILGLNLAVTLFLLLVIGITKLIFSRKEEFIDIDDYYGIGKVLHFPWFFLRNLFEEQDDTVRLTGKGITLGIWVKGFKWAFAIAWIAETLGIAVSVLWGTDSWNEQLLAVTKSWYLLPMASFQLLQQLQFLLEDISDEEAEDSVSNLPLWQGGDGPVREDIVHSSGIGGFSIRRGFWKLNLVHDGGGMDMINVLQDDEPDDKFFEPTELYDLRDDVSETSNVIQDHPELVKELSAALAEHIRRGRSTEGADQPFARTRFDGTWPQISWIEDSDEIVTKKDHT